VDELAVGELLDTDHADLDDRPQEPGQRRAEIAGEAVVYRVQCADVILADPLGALEVVLRDVSPCGLGGRGSRLAAALAAAGRRPRWRRFRGHGCQQGVNFGLVKDVAQARTRGKRDRARPGRGTGLSVRTIGARCAGR